MRQLVEDIRRAVRQVTHARGFTAVAVITLALGIGGHTIFFSAVNAMVFRPIRATRTDGLYVVQYIDKKQRAHGPLTADQFRKVEADQPDSIEISTWAIVLSLILLVDLIAAYFPERPASRIDPNVALREL
jgi:hypothetical protein